MKKALFISILLTLLLCSAAPAQETNLQPKRIAFINKLKFGDEKQGVGKYVNALKAAENPGFIPQPETDPAKRKALYEKRYKSFVEPVEKEIAIFLKEIATQNNLIILDVIELDRRGQILILNDKLDITYKVIPLINEYFETKAKPNLTINVSEAKIGRINTKFFLDEKLGITKLAEKVQETKNFIKQQTGNEPTPDEIKAFIMKNQSKDNYFFRIIDFMQSFAEKNGFEVVFDPSYKLPSELLYFQTYDVTKDFISYYNQLNP